MYKGRKTCLLAGALKIYIKKKNEVFVVHFLNSRVKPDPLRRDLNGRKNVKAFIISLLF